MKSFPIFLAVAGRPVVIVGGGEQAAQKARLVARTEARMVLMAPALNAELTGRVVSGAHHVAAVCDPMAFRGAALVFVATGCAGADAAISAVAKAEGAVVNVVDRPDLCDVTMPAIVDRDPVVVAIGTEGTAPVLARRIKTAVERMLEPDLGAFAALAGRLRRSVERHVPKPARRAFWDWAFDTPRRLFTAGRQEEARAAIDAALAAGRAPGARDGFVSLVGAGPGAADMLTLRAVERLQSADIIFHDRLVDEAVLELARRDADRVAVGKAPGGYGWRQEEIDRAIVEAAREGLRVVRLKAGDPGVFGRAAEEVAALTEAGIAWEIVVGVTAASAAAAETGSFLTERGAIRAITLATGHTADGERPDWAALARPGSAGAFYMAVAKAADIEADLIADGVPGHLSVDIVENASRPGMRQLSCRLDRLAETVSRETVRNPAILLLRWPEAASAVIPRAEERGAHTHIGGAERDRLLEIAAHPH